MKIRKVSCSQFRCNFCLDWHVSKIPQLPPSSFNICEQCFTKARGTSSFKVVHPSDLEVYEVRLRKTGLVGDEARSVNTQVLGELLDFYENAHDKGRIQMLRNYLTDCEALEANLFRHNDPFIDFVNEVYKFEVGRVESIWEDVLRQITEAAKLVEAQRGSITSSLDTYQYDVGLDQARIFSTEVYRHKIEQMRAEADRILKTQLEKVRELYAQTPERFFLEGFDIRDPSEPNEPTTMFQIPG